MSKRKRAWLRPDLLEEVPDVYREEKAYTEMAVVELDPPLVHHGGVKVRYVFSFDYSGMRVFLALSSRAKEACSCNIEVDGDKATFPADIEAALLELGYELQQEDTSSLLASIGPRWAEVFGT